MSDGRWIGRDTKKRHPATKAIWDWLAEQDEETRARVTQMLVELDIDLHALNTMALARTNDSLS